MNLLSNLFLLALIPQYALRVLLSWCIGMSFTTGRLFDVNPYYVQFSATFNYLQRAIKRDLSVSSSGVSLTSSIFGFIICILLL